MADDFDVQLVGWGPQARVYDASAVSTHGLEMVARPASAPTSPLPLPSRIGLRSSMTLSQNSLSPALSPLRTTSPSTLETLRAELCEASGHIVRCCDYARDPLLAPCDTQLVGVEPLYAKLDQVVGRTLANPTLVPCDRPMIAVQAPRGNGTHRAVHAWAALRAPQRMAVLTYSFYDPTTELGVIFHAQLLALAALLSPCILVIHRIIARAGEPRLIEGAYNALWTAWLSVYEHRQQQPGVAPPFWLLFIDDMPPASIAPGHWRCIPHTIALTGFEQRNVTAYISCALQHAIAQRLADPTHHVALLAYYAPAVASIVAQSAASFTTVADVVFFVTVLFSLPLRDISVEELADMYRNGATPNALPSIEHFPQALLELVNRPR
jgi:hypothetical protein